LPFIFIKCYFLKIHEFIFYCRFTTPELIQKKYPLLGRQKEIKIFQRMLSDFITQFTLDGTIHDLQIEHNVLIIKWVKYNIPLKF